MNLLDKISPELEEILTRALDGQDISWKDGLRLCETTGLDLQAVVVAADELRRRQCGDVVTYVVNRNINFTNVCVKHCGFCAFSRTHRSDEGYFLEVDEVVRRVLEARALGATEVCLQAGLAPGLDGDFYLRLCRAVKQAAPD